MQNDGGDKKEPEIISRSITPLPGGGAIGRRRQVEERKKAMREFVEWKAALIGMIKTGTRIEFTPTGEHVFVLPPKLVHLVWATTIKERIKEAVQQATRDGNDASLEEVKAKALEGLRREVEGAQEAFLRTPDMADTVKGADRLTAIRSAEAEREKEEEQAAKALADLRAKLVAEKEGA